MGAALAQPALVFFWAPPRLCRPHPSRWWLALAGASAPLLLQGSGPALVDRWFLLCLLARSRCPLRPGWWLALRAPQFTAHCCAFCFAVVCHRSLFFLWPPVLALTCGAAAQLSRSSCNARLQCLAWRPISVGFQTPSLAPPSRASSVARSRSRSPALLSRRAPRRICQRGAVALVCGLAAKSSPTAPTPHTRLQASSVALQPDAMGPPPCCFRQHPVSAGRSSESDVPSFWPTKMFSVERLLNTPHRLSRVH